MPELRDSQIKNNGYKTRLATLMITMHTKSLRRLYKKSVEMPIIIILLITLVDQSDCGLILRVTEKKTKLELHLYAIMTKFTLTIKYSEPIFFICIHC